MLSFHQLPPFTPGTNKKVGEALRMTYDSWTIHSSTHDISPDPRDWTIEQVNQWLCWTKTEFSLASEAFDNFIQDFKVLLPFINVGMCT